MLTAFALIYQHTLHLGSYLRTRLHKRIRQLRELPDGGYSTEATLVTAALVTLALAVMAILAAKVRARINATNL